MAWAVAGSWPHDGPKTSLNRGRPAAVLHHGMADISTFGSASARASNCTGRPTGKREHEKPPSSAAVAAWGKASTPCLQVTQSRTTCAGHRRNLCRLIVWAVIPGPPGPGWSGGGGCPGGPPPPCRQSRVNESGRTKTVMTSPLLTGRALSYGGSNAPCLSA